MLSLKVIQRNSAKSFFTKVKQLILLKSTFWHKKEVYEIDPKAIALTRYGSYNLVVQYLQFWIMHIYFIVLMYFLLKHCNKIHGPRRSWFLRRMDSLTCLGVFPKLNSGRGNAKSKGTLKLTKCYLFCFKNIILCCESQFGRARAVAGISLFFDMSSKNVCCHLIY